MSIYDNIPRVAMQVSRDVVVASIQVDLDDEVLSRFREDLLSRVHQTGSRAVILDVSGVDTLDSDEFAALRGIISMITIMGSQSVLVGLQPGVVSALIEMDVDVAGLQTAIDLDAAFELIEVSPDIEAEADDEDPTEARSELSQGDMPDAGDANVSGSERLFGDDS
ncbi:MAG: STAS domain-containing protein [Gammaproteobacteria bacterium]